MQPPEESHHHFQVKKIPPGNFELFRQTSDYFIYEKKFECDLPQDIIPPKSFHYPYSLENFCKPDLLTMNFELKSSNNILTDPKINTFIHQDFINNSLELISPDLTNISKPLSSKEEKLKEEIINIINRNDKPKIENDSIWNDNPIFLRRNTYLRPTSYFKEENISKTNDAKDTNNNQEKKISVEELREKIDKTFSDIRKYNIGAQHPNKENVTITEVFDLLPLEDPTQNISECMFLGDPCENISLKNNRKFPEHFVLLPKLPTENSKNNDIECKLYKNESFLNEEKPKNSAEYYTHEKDYMMTYEKKEEIFNKYIIFLNHKENNARITPMKNKINLKKYKKIITNENLIGNKRERDLIIEPREISDKAFNYKSELLLNMGFKQKLIKKKIEPDFTCAYRMKKEIMDERKKELEIDENEVENDVINDENQKNEETDNENVDEIKKEEDNEEANESDEDDVFADED